MENRSLEITVVSAKGLKKAKHISKMDVYVTVKLSGDPKYTGQREQRTHVARNGGTSPKWTNSVVRFTVDEALAKANRLVVTFKIMCERGVRGDKDIGEVHVPVKELLDHLGADKIGQRYVAYKVKKPNGKPRGEINFMYKFGDQVARSGGAGGFVVQALQLPNPEPYPRPHTPALAQLLPSWGSFSHGGCFPTPTQSYIHTTLAPPAIYPPETPPAGYPMVGSLHIPPAGYPTGAPPIGYPPEGPTPPQAPPFVYPPTGEYRF